MTHGRLPRRTALPRPLASSGAAPARRSSAPAWTGRTTGPAGPASVLISVGEGAEPPRPPSCRGTAPASCRTRRLSRRGAQYRQERHGRPGPHAVHLHVVARSRRRSSRSDLPTPRPVLRDQGVETGARSAASFLVVRFRWLLGPRGRPARGRCAVGRRRIFL